MPDPPPRTISITFWGGVGGWGGGRVSPPPSKVPMTPSVKYVQRLQRRKRGATAYIPYIYFVRL